MAARLPSYLKTYRRRTGFSQDEMAFLLGSASGTKVSRYERWARKSTLETALAYEAMFQMPVKELFAGVYQKVEKKAVRRARAFAVRLLANAKPDNATARKLAVLRKIASGSLRAEATEA